MESANAYEYDLTEIHYLLDSMNDSFEIWFDLVDTTKELDSTKHLLALTIESCISTRAKIAPSLHVNLSVQDKKFRGLVDTRASENILQTCLVEALYSHDSSTSRENNRAWQWTTHLNCGEYGAAVVNKH